MLKPRTWALLGLGFLGLVLAFGFAKILEHRLSEGGLYPHYASFRTDPLGTSAFYETLEGMDEFEVRRNLVHLTTVGGLDSDTTLLLLGYPRDGLDDLRAPEDSPVMEAVEKGARLVISLNPGLVPEAYRPVASDEEQGWLDRRRELRNERIRERGGEDDESEDAADEPIDSGFEKRMAESLGQRLTKKLGFDLAEVREFDRPEEGWETRPGETVSDEGMPAALPEWRSQFRFRSEDEAWRDAVLVEGEPVVIERKYGDGTIVLASDSFFASNEALHAGAEPEFLLWLVGDRSKIVFDETIHGIRESGGAAKLIRRYRLHGVFLGLLVFVGLWAWRSASTLAPGSEELDRGLVGGTAVAGEGTNAGLIRLLRKSVPRDALLGRCLDTWRKSRRGHVSASREKEIAAIAARHADDPRGLGLPEAYAAIADLLRKR
ncbi:MAG: DUF4350 domain-containing protein [Verrucomicrobiales bacterium]